MINEAESRNVRTFVKVVLALLALLCLVLLMQIKISSGRLNGDESLVIREIQTIHQAETQYMSQYGRYATLAELGPKAGDLLPASLAAGDKDGYRFTVHLTLVGYAINAAPKTYNQTGRRTFYSDQSMSIHQNWTAEPATATSPEMR